MPEGKEISHEEIIEAAARDALHPDGIESFTPNEIRMHIVDLPKTVKGNSQYDPEKRLQALWETEIDVLPDGPEKEELMTLYDNKACELFSEEIINLPVKNEAENPHYQPAKRLGVIELHVREFPFARAEAQEKMYVLLDNKMKELGVSKLIGDEGQLL